MTPQLPLVSRPHPRRRVFGSLLLATALGSFFASAIHAQDDPLPPGVDRIHLDVGTVLDGRIVQETDGYVEIEIAPGTLVGFDKARTVRIIRGAPTTDDDAGGATGTASAAEGIAPSDDWAVLHDAEGSAVGWLQRSVQPDGEGRLRFSEEWSFSGKDGTVEVTVLEVVGADGTPVSAFCHERIRPAAGQPGTGRERIVRARMQGRKLVIERSNSSGRSRDEHEVPPGLRFPLSLNAELRARPAGHHARETHLLFDPVDDTLVRRTFDVGRIRMVELEGRPQRVRVLAIERARGRLVEWLDAAGRPLRREVTGPSLVALAAPESEARRAVERRRQVAPAAFGTDHGSAVGLWLPNPAWHLDETGRDGAVTAVSSLDESTFTAWRLEQLDADLLATSALDAVLRWLRQVHGDLEVVARGVREIRGLAAEGLRGAYRVKDGGRSRIFEIEVHVVQDGAGWVALCATMPRDRASSVAADLDWMLERIELRPEGFLRTEDVADAVLRRRR